MNTGRDPADGPERSAIEVCYLPRGRGAGRRARCGVTARRTKAGIPRRAEGTEGRGRNHA